MTLDTTTTTWLQIKTHCAARIELLRDELEVSTNDTNIAMTQGRLAELRELMSLAEPPPPLAPVDDI